MAFGGVTLRKASENLRLTRKPNIWSHYSRKFEKLGVKFSDDVFPPMSNVTRLMLIIFLVLRTSNFVFPVKKKNLFQ